MKTKKAGGGLGGRAQRLPQSQAKVLASLVVVVVGFVVAAAAAGVVVVGFVVGFLKLFHLLLMVAPAAAMRWAAFGRWGS